MRADTVFLGIGARSSTLDLVDWISATGATRIVPIHWDGFFRPLSWGPSPMVNVDLDEFFRTLSTRRPNLRSRTLDYGETIALPAPSQP